MGRDRYSFSFRQDTPFMPPKFSKESEIFVSSILSKRRREIAERKVLRRDFLQIFYDWHEADPINFPEAHLKAYIGGFM